MINKTIALLFIGIIILSCSKNDSDEIKESSELIKFNGIKHVLILKAESTNSQNFIYADTIQYFSGEDAAIAYRIDTGKELEEKTFYIRNNTADSIKFAVSDSLNLITKTFDFTNDNTLRDVSLFKKFETFISSDIRTYISTLPFKLTIVDNEVVVIEEIYIP